MAPTLAKIRKLQLQLPKLNLFLPSKTASRRPRTEQPELEVHEGVLAIHIEEISALKEVVRTLEARIYDEATTKVVITKSETAPAPTTHKAYSRLIRAIGRLPNLQELCLLGSGDRYSRTGLILPARDLEKALKDASQTIRIVRIQKIGLVARKKNNYSDVGHEEYRALFDALPKLKCLREIEISNCFQVTKYFRCELYLLDVFGPLSAVPSLEKVTLLGGNAVFREELGPCHLQPLFQSCPSLEELVVSGFTIRSSTWRHVVPDLLSARQLRKLHLDHCHLDKESMATFLDLLGPESPLEDIVFHPVIGGVEVCDSYRIGADDGDDETDEVTWRHLLTQTIPSLLRHNSRLQRLRIKVEGRINLLIPVEIQTPWLELLEEGYNKSLHDFGLLRTDAFFLHYEDDAAAAKFEHYQKLNRFGIGKLEAARDSERDQTMIEVLANASGDVPCLFHFLQQHPSLCC